MRTTCLLLLVGFAVGIFASRDAFGVDQQDPNALFHKGVRLAKAGKFSESEPFFLEYLEIASEQPVCWNLIHANGWMSDVTRRAGRREEQLAYEQKALELTEAAYEAGLYGRRICYLDACIFRLFEMHRSEWVDGRIGSCKRILEKARPYYDELVSLSSYETNRGNWYHMITNHKYGKWLFERMEADMLWATGDQQEMIAILENIVREIEFAGTKAPLDERNLLQLHAHAGLAANAYEEIGDFEKSLELYDKTIIEFEEYPFLNSNTALTMLDMLKIRICRDGADASSWREMDKACDKALKSPSPSGRVSVYRTYAQALLKAGRPEDALVYVNKAMDAARSMQVRQWLPGTLRTRAAIYVALERPDDAITDLLEAVEVTRVTACKVDEAYLFQTYGRALCQKNEIMSALLVWEIGIELSERFHKPYLTLDILCDILETHIKQGNREDAWLTRQRIKQHLEKYPDIQPVWRKRLPELTDRYDSLVAAVQKSTLLDGAQQGDLTALENEDKTLPQKNEKNAEQTRDALVLPSRIALQPVVVESAAVQGQALSTRFSAVNLDDSQVQTEVTFADGVSQVRWDDNPDEQLLVAYVDEESGKQDEITPHRIKIGPGQVYNVVLHAVCQDSVDETRGEDAQSSVVLILKEGEKQHTATWRFGATATDRRLAVMDASLIKVSPFYRIPFYHKISVPDGDDSIVDLGLAASRSCRIEVYAEDSEEPVAIDCNGDGDFDDSGDAFFLDQNQNGIPDLPTGTENGTKNIEVWVYPYDATVSSGTEDIDIEVYVGENGKLELSAVDTLSASR